MKEILKVVLALSYIVTILFVVTLPDETFFLIVNWSFRVLSCFVLLWLGITYIFRDEIDRWMEERQRSNLST